MLAACGVILLPNALLVFDNRLDNLIQRMLRRKIDRCFDPVQLGDTSGKVIKTPAVGDVVGDVVDRAL